MKKYTKNIAFLGPEGSYSHIALKQYATMKNFNKITEYSCKNFKEIIQLIKNKKVKCGILPIENSTSGAIDEVYDILQTTRLFLIDEIHIPITHCILTTPNTSFKEIQTIYSHPQPFQQCSQFLKNFPKWNFIFCNSSAEAMKKISNMKHPHSAALGNAESGKLLYGLKALKIDLANKKNNTTRFIILGHKNIIINKNTPAKTTIILSIRHQSNILENITLILHTCNITKYHIIIRPTQNSQTKKILFVDIEANLHNKQTQYALKKIQNITSSLKILGCYPKTPPIYIKN